MKNSLMIILCSLTLVNVCGCSKNSNKIQDGVKETADSVVIVDKEKEDSQQIANPFTQCDSLQQAMDLAGFDITCPDTIDSLSIGMIEVLDSDIKMIEVTYVDNLITLRKANSSEDISGDYNEYDYQQDIQIESYQVTLKGDDENNIHLAIYLGNGYSYAMRFSEAVSLDTVNSVIATLK